MRRKITVAGGGELAVAVTELLAATDLHHVVCAGGSWSDAAGSDIVVVAGAEAGEAARQAALRCPGAVVVVAGEEVEAACREVLVTARPPRARVVGVRGEVEGSRLAAAVARALGVSPRDVSALVLGGGGRAAVPVLSALRVAGLPVTDKLPAERVAEIVAGLRDGPPASAREIAGAVVETVAAIAFDRRRVMACAALCLGELEIERAVAGVPVVLGAGGIERILDLVLDPEEREALAAAAVPLEPSTG